MKHFFTILAVLLLLVTPATTPLITVAEEQGNTNVILLESLPGIGSAGEQAPNLGSYLDGIFKLALGIATGLAVVMIVIGGVEYMGSESIFKKDAGREKIQDALWGLLLALGAFLLLQTINPALVRFDIVNTLNRVIEKASEPPTAGGPGAGCTNCVPVTGLPLKAGICGGGQCVLESGLIESLRALNNFLSTEGIGWHITEAYPPTITHENACHRNGTCVDANLTGLPIPGDIRRVIEGANNSLMTACYEVGSSGERDGLIGQGVPSANVTVVPPRPDGTPGITAPHFSIYGYRTSC